MRQTLHHLTLNLPLQIKPEIFYIILTSSSTTLESLTLINLAGPSRYSSNTANLARYFSTTLFRNLRHLTLGTIAFNADVGDLFGSLPSLTALEVCDALTDREIRAIGYHAPHQLERLSFTSLEYHLNQSTFGSIRGVLRLQNLDHLRQLDLRSVPLSAFANPIALSLLRECEERGCTVSSRFDYL